MENCEGCCCKSSLDGVALKGASWMGFWQLGKSLRRFLLPTSQIVLVSLCEQRMTRNEFIPPLMVRITVLKA